MRSVQVTHVDVSTSCYMLSMAYSIVTAQAANMIQILYITNMYCSYIRKPSCKLAAEAVYWYTVPHWNVTPDQKLV